MSSILERNLEALLRRAYEPARMSAPFRESLRERWLARVAPRLRTPRALPRVAAIFLAVLSCGAAFALWRSTRGPAPDLVAILAAGDVAVRPDPAGPWSRAGAAERANGLDFEPPFLELATPDSSGVRVALGSRPVELRATRSARLTIGEELGTVRVELRAGGLALHGGAGGDELRVVTSEGAVLHTAGALALVYVPPGEIGALAGRLAGLVVARPLVRIRVDGTAWLAATGVAIRGERFLQSGALLEPTDPGSATAVRDSGADREPVQLAADPLPEDVDAPATGFACTGRVRDAETGEPVADFRVWTLRSVALPKVAEPEHFDFESREDGDFTVASVADGKYRVFVEAQGYAVWKATLTLPRAEGDDPLEVRLVRGGSARGYVTDAATGAPIAGALVLAELDLPYQLLGFDGPMGPMPAASATTDTSGAYVLEHLTPNRHLLRVSAAGYAPRWTPFVEVGTGPACDVPLVELTPGGHIFGRVERADGSAWVGAEIVASMFVMNRPNLCMTFGFDTTGPDGRYSIEHVPAGHYVLLNTTEQPNAAPQWERVLQASMPKEGELEVNFLSPTSQTHVTGRLTGAAGEPVAGLSITFSPDPYGSSFTGWRATPADADGAYEFTDVAPGVYGVFVSRSISIEMTLVRVVEVPAEPEFQLDLTLHDTEIRGTMSTAGDAGRPGAVTLLAVRVDGGPVGVTYFAGKLEVARPGSFEFPWLEPGDYLLYAIDDAGELWADTSGRLAVVPGQPLVHDFEFRSGGDIRVALVDPYGHPVDGARVRFVDDDGESLPLPPQMTTGAAGVLESGAVRPGRWTVIASKSGYRRAEARLVVLEGETVERTLVLEPR
ncbi:MAG: carboxypeptidase regulatory-like domain-containing protein [Planctomycetota bacterium]|nr:MAG: carboxypeptidase regulatory-like domain-containing protein [Planctomycetota bacterium]